MKKFVFTFGSGQLLDFYVRPTTVALVVDAENENEARTKVFKFEGIGSKFFTSYEYEDVIDEFKNLYGMEEFTLSDLEKCRIN